MPFMVEFETTHKAPLNVIYINAKSIHTAQPHPKVKGLTEIIYGQENHIVVREECSSLVDRLHRIFEDSGA